MVPENVLCLDRERHTIDNRATFLLPQAAVSQARLSAMMAADAGSLPSLSDAAEGDPLVRGWP